MLEARERDVPAVRGQAKCWCVCGRAACAGPTCTSSTASCRTSELPLVPGHEIVGSVERLGDGVSRISRRRSRRHPLAGIHVRRVRVLPERPREPVREARFTGYQIDGGYAEYTVADAPLRVQDPGRVQRCRSGAAAVRRADRISRVSRMAATRGGSASTGSARRPTSSRRSPWHEGREVYAFTSPGDVAAQGVCAITRRACGPAHPPTRRRSRWMPRSSSRLSVRSCPRRCRRRSPGGIVVCAGIHMSDIPAFPYGSCGTSGTCDRSRTSRDRTPTSSSRWRRRCRYGRTSARYELEHANEALADLRRGRVEGAAVLVPRQPTRSMTAQERDVARALSQRSVFRSSATSIRRWRPRSRPTSTGRASTRRTARTCSCGTRRAPGITS